MPLPAPLPNCCAGVTGAIPCPDPVNIPSLPKFLMASNVPELNLAGYWCNVNTYGDYNKLHNHRGSVLSGVFYIDVPDENMGNIIFERSDDIEYYLPPLKEYNNFTGGRATYKPESGKVLIFPSWLKHQVEGSRSEQQRISISFNYGA